MAYKICARCKSNLPHTAEFFHSDKRIKSTLARWCRVCHNEDSKLRLRRIRVEVLDYYGNKCVCCGESQLEFLGIDHIEGNGNKHRKAIKGASIYRWLKQNKYPIGFEI